MLEETTNNPADYPGHGTTLSETPNEPTVTSQISDLAASAANQDYSTTSRTSDPMLNIIESLLKSAAISNSASLNTLALLTRRTG